MLGRVIRKRHYYKVPEAGAKLGLKRSQAYKAALAGLIPTERDGRLLLVPKKKWNRRLKQLLRGTRSRRARNPAESRNRDRSQIEDTMTKTPP